MAKLPLAIKKCDSILLIRDDFTCDGQHKDVFESYALSKYRPDKNIRAPPICRRIGIWMSNFCLKIWFFQIFGLPPSMCWLTGYKCPSNMKQPQRPDVGRVHCHLLWHFIMLFRPPLNSTVQGQKTGTFYIPEHQSHLYRGRMVSSGAVVCWNWRGAACGGWCHQLQSGHLSLLPAWAATASQRRHHTFP